MRLSEHQDSTYPGISHLDLVKQGLIREVPRGMKRQVGPGGFLHREGTLQQWYFRGRV